MHANMSIIIPIIGVFTFIGALNSAVFSEEYEEHAKFYESCIVKEIAKCNSKLVLLKKTKSENLQDYAKTEAQKALFLDAEKEILVKEMIEMQLEPKHYKVEFFLNKRFQESGFKFVKEPNIKVPALPGRYID